MVLGEQQFLPERKASFDLSEWKKLSGGRREGDGPGQNMFSVMWGKAKISKFAGEA